ncbi:hypothetical protein N9B60_04725 [Mariniblastus sp.]|nr:hypothetical protein [Mariniblastus sp.]
MEPRQLTETERHLVQWLLENGTHPDAAKFRHEADTVEVRSRCDCGCASINFTDDIAGGMQVLSDYGWTAQSGNQCGIFVFAQDNKLAGLEVWSVDGEADVVELPETSVLTPLKAAR